MKKFITLIKLIVLSIVLTVAVTIINTQYAQYSLDNSQNKLIQLAMEKIDTHPVLGVKYKDDLPLLDNVSIVLVNDITDSSSGWIYNNNDQIVYINTVWIVSREEAINVIAHEITHLLQIRYYGLNEYKRLYLSFENEVGYWDNPMEIEARATYTILRIRTNSRHSTINADLAIEKGK
jgi:hypothetical protein